MSRIRLALVLVSAVMATSCSSATSSSPSATPTPTTTRPASGITPVPQPDNATDPAFQWFVHPAPDGAHVLLGVRRAAGEGPHPAVLLVHASGGLNTDYLAFADALAERGFDVAVGCWFGNVETSDPQSVTIPCTDSPSFKGVVDEAVPDLDSLVDAAHQALAPSEPLALVGFSRGAGIAALRASEGRTEPVVLVSGMYEGWNDIGSTVPGGQPEVNVVDRVDGWRVSALILHGMDDGAVPVSQAQDLEAALRARGVDVESHYYDGAGHNLSGEAAVADLRQTITDFLCARFTCPTLP